MARLLFTAGFVSAALWVGFMGSFLGTLGVWSFGSVVYTSLNDAVRLRPGGRREPFQLRGALLALTIALLAWMVCLQVLDWTCQRVVVHLPVRVVGRPGRAGVLMDADDHVLISRLAYRRANPRRGDIVLATMAIAGFEYPVIQRIVGTPGDEVRFDGVTLIVNGSRGAGESVSAGGAEPAAGLSSWE